MSIAMKDVRINPDLLKIISKIAKDRQINENEIINEIISNGILELEEKIDLSNVAKEFGQTKEELIKELEESETSESIVLDVDELEERYKI